MNYESKISRQGVVPARQLLLTTTLRTLPLDRHRFSVSFPVSGGPRTVIHVRTPGLYAPFRDSFEILTDAYSVGRPTLYAKGGSATTLCIEEILKFLKRNEPDRTAPVVFDAHG